MSNRIIGVIGLCITVLFILGFLSLFLYNPITFEEIDNLSLAAFNLPGMNGWWLAAYVNYLTIGFLNIAFAYGVIKISKNDLPIIIGKVFILLAGIIWASFGIVGWNPDSEISGHIYLIRVISFLLIGPLGLLLLGHEFETIIKDRFSKYFTLATGTIILLLGILSVFIFNDPTWMRTNISMALYFLWFAVIGLRFVQRSSIS